MTAGYALERQTGLNKVVVDISGLVVSDNPTDLLITYSLGSCLGLTIYDPVAKIGGLVHCMLPLSKTDPNKAANAPGMFVDTGIPTMFKAAFEMGAKKDRLIIKAAGCGSMLDENGHFRIGERNHMVLRKILWRNNLMLDAEHVGGNLSRTVMMEIATGTVKLRIKGQEIEL